MAAAHDVVDAEAVCLRQAQLLELIARRFPVNDRVAELLDLQALAPRIRVNAIAPGITLPSADQTESEFEAAQATPPLGHGSSPDDLVQALRYLVSAESMTGQTLVVDGGQSLTPAARDVMFAVRGED